MSQESSCSSHPGIYLGLLRAVLGWPKLTPLWALWKYLFKEKLRKTVVIPGETKLHPAVAEGYQLLMVVALAMALCAVPSGPEVSLWWWGFLALASYRSWEILIYGLKWLLVDPEPLHSYRRSLVAFLINMVELSAAYTVLGFRVSPGQPGQWHQAFVNIGRAFKLEGPQSLVEPYASLFAIESWILVVFVLACVISGIQRESE